MTETILRIDGLTKVYRSGFGGRVVRAVNGLSFTADRGSVVAIVGPNGAGKTTTIYAMLGLIHPDQGDITIFGLPVCDPSVRRRIGYQSEIFYTYPFLTARAAMMFYARLGGIDVRAASAEIPRILTRIGLAGAADRKVGSFSKGMVQRMGLAQALLGSPDILILDEPTTGLDPQGRKLVAELILEEKARGATIFLSSHILADVERTCDRVIMIRAGEPVLSEDMSAIARDAGIWEIDVPDWNDAWTAKLSAQGVGPPDIRGATAYFRCEAPRKQEILRALLDLHAGIGSVRTVKKTLEDYYMEHAGEAGDG